MTARNSSATVSFYTVDNGIVSVHNGFSWCGDIGEAWMVALGDDLSALDGHQKVWVSHHKASTMPDLQAKIVRGGPRDGPIEDLLGRPLSGVWDYAGLERLPRPELPTDLCVPIGVGCIWARCSYCMDFPHVRYRLRPGWDAVLCSDFAPGRKVRQVDLCMPGPGSDVLSRIIEILPAIRAERVVTFARAPDLAIALRDQRGSLDKTKFRVGLEAMTDTILARMRRGMCVSDVLAVCGEVIARGGQVTLQMMSPLPGEIGDEQRARTSDAVADLQRRGLIVSDNGPTFWRRREDASEFGRPLATLGGWTAV